MENFFIEENFFMDLEGLMDHFDLFSEQDVMELEEDWDQKVELSELQPMFQLDLTFIVDSVMEMTDKWEDRWPQDDDDKTAEDVRSAIKKGIDVDAINKYLPKLYYPTGEFEIITKQDLLEYIR